MPLPLLAHQAPVLPLKLWRPRDWNGTALVLGSVAPDLAYLSALSTPGEGRAAGHSLAGQFLFCLPITLSLVLLIGRLRLGDVLVSRLGSRFAWLAGAATDVMAVGGFERAFRSALVGSFSHVALDAVTHTVLPAMLPERMVHVARLTFSTPAILQILVSGGGALLAVWLLVRIAGLGAKEVPVARPGRAVLALLALLGGALGLLLDRPAMRNPDAYFYAGPLYVWGHLAFFAASGAAAGTLAGATILALWDRRASARSRPAGLDPVRLDD